MKTMIPALILALTLGGGVACAQSPNLDGADRNIRNAIALLQIAQQQNNFRLGGHADNAIASLGQALREVRAAKNYRCSTNRAC